MQSSCLGPSFSGLSIRKQVAENENKWLCEQRTKSWLLWRQEEIFRTVEEEFMEREGELGTFTGCFVCCFIHFKVFKSTDFVDGGFKSNPLEKQSFQMQSLLRVVHGVLFRFDTTAHLNRHWFLFFRWLKYDVLLIPSTAAGRRLPAVYG